MTASALESKPFAPWCLRRLEKLNPTLLSPEMALHSQDPSDRLLMTAREVIAHRFPQSCWCPTLVRFDTRSGCGDMAPRAHAPLVEHTTMSRREHSGEDDQHVAIGCQHRQHRSSSGWPKRDIPTDESEGDCLSARSWFNSGRTS